jgi:hypothetical protein
VNAAAGLKRFLADVNKVLFKALCSLSQERAAVSLP